MNELKPDAQEMLRLARDARSPTDADRARMQGKIALAIAAGAVGSTAQAAAARAAGTGAGIARTATVLKAGTALASIVVIAIAVHFAGSSEPDVAPPQIRTEPHEIAPVIEAPIPVAAPEVPVEPSPQIAIEEPVAPSPRREPRARREPPDLAAEIALLHEAQAAWRAGDGARTLSLVSDHEESFPRSQFAPERTALRILAACQLGRTAEARRLGARFLRSAADSPLRRSVEESCASSE